VVSRTEARSVFLGVVSDDVLELNPVLLMSQIKLITSSVGSH